MKKLILIKLGGSLITDKSKPFTARPAVMRRLGTEIKYALAQNKKLKIILAHGSGSFGHVPAAKYGTADGFTDRKGKLGACITHDVAAQINRIVIREFLSIGLPVASVAPSSLFISRHGRPDKAFFDPIEILVSRDIIPILYGDVIWDTTQGCSIFSGESSLGIIAKHLLQNGWTIKRSIECGIEDGVYDQKHRVIPLITRENFGALKRHIGGSAGIDVTGGMLHKVEESLELARLGIETIILNGTVPRRLHDALVGTSIPGTKIM